MLEPQPKVKFLQAIDSVLTKQNERHGAASRSEFWNFQLFLLLISNFFILPLDAIFISYGVAFPMSTLWLFVIIRLNFTLTIRRLYDSGTEIHKGYSGLIAIVAILLSIHGGTYIWWGAFPMALIASGYYFYVMQLKSWHRDFPRGSERETPNFFAKKLRK